MVLFDEDKDEIGWGGYPNGAWDVDSHALVARGSAGGCVLATGGPVIACELESMGPDLGDIGLGKAPLGLSVWTGRLRVSRDMEGCVDSEVIGTFRPVTPFEMAQTLAGASPWDEQAWGRVEEQAREAEAQKGGGA